MTEIHRGTNLVVCQDEEEGHFHIYYGGVYRASIGSGFVAAAELSFTEKDDYVVVLSAGQPVMHFPLTLEGKLLGPNADEIDWQNELPL
jgi:hypothetical protein